MLVTVAITLINWLLPLQKSAVSAGASKDQALPKGAVLSAGHVNVETRRVTSMKQSRLFTEPVALLTVNRPSPTGTVTRPTTHRLVAVGLALMASRPFTVNR